MKTQAPQLAALPVEHHRHVRGIEPAGNFGYERGENVTANEIVGDSGVVL